jgi:hypothetical protein
MRGAAASVAYKVVESAMGAATTDKNIPAIVVAVFLILPSIEVGEHKANMLSSCDGRGSQTRYWDYGRDTRQPPHATR